MFSFRRNSRYPIVQQSDVKSKSFTATVEDGVLRVRNHTEQPLLIQSLKVGDSEELLNVVVDGGETGGITSGGGVHERPNYKCGWFVSLTWWCRVHGARSAIEPSATSRHLLPEIIFDLGVMLTGNSVADAARG